ncbi:peptidoglycan editing factor PgeF [Staphylococcus gallinarum]|uniref:peptidoglycan editing factor PgeF n=1 Tax=Staphylococcus gallinarum TaxID=1293 RepID=UPI00227FCA01|nr:peptidoglycan editing factor PgeF [Staphylococcus gallinarum]MDN6412432.1 peptidoglycan editing factor PgeF [Staphylococcus gallinarum]
MPEKFVENSHILEYREDPLQNVTLGITTRKHGFSDYPNHAFNMARYIDDNPQNITKHQQKLAKLIKFDRAHWVFPIQTHENKVVEITEEHQGMNIDTLTDDLHGVDGMYSYESNILLTMCYADCVPIYFYSEKHHFIGLAHAGWRGTVGQIVVEMINKIDFNLNDLQVVIGPATSMSYEINDDIKAKFAELPIDSTKYIETRASDRHGIDLKVANALLLQHSGVPKENIYITNYATSEDLDLFFSYRVEKGQTGRMLAFIGQK